MLKLCPHTRRACALKKMILKKMINADRQQSPPQQEETSYNSMSTSNECSARQIMSILPVSVVSCRRSCSMVGESTNFTVLVVPTRDCLLAK